MKKLIGKQRVKILGHWFAALGMVSAAYGILSADGASLGLVTHFVDVVVPHVAMGRLYDLSRVQSQNFSITNTSQRALSIVVDKEIPETGFLKPGYEPIPDPSWLEVVPASFELKPGEEKSGKVHLRVPMNSKWKGRHFQAALWTHSSKGSMAVGLRSYVRFSVESDNPLIVPVIKETGLRFTDVNLMGSDVKAGEKTLIGTVVLRNEIDQPRVVDLRSVRPLDSSHKGSQIIPNPDFIKISPQHVEIGPKGSVVVRLFAEVPAGLAHSGKKYAFSVRGDVKNETVPAIFSDLFLRVKR